MPVPPSLFSGSIIESIDLKNAGYAEVDGFHRFPSLSLAEDSEVSRATRQFNTNRHNSRRSTAMLASFGTDIRPLFRDSPDVDSMQGYGLDLSNYEDVKTRASEIYTRLEDGSMPCDEAWPAERLALFKRWMDEGCAP
jgi:hypothetical protein